MPYVNGAVHVEGDLGLNYSGCAIDIDKAHTGTGRHWLSSSGLEAL